ncbi:hypothetical protein AAE478_008200 [Parahypoxylon ruwenzoriense]
MSVEIWPPISPNELKIQEHATQARELTWLLGSLHSTLAQLKRGLQDCCVLLAPTEPGSTLALTTPRHETVKGHTTRVGTRLVRGLMHLRLRTLPPQTLSLDPSRPIRIAPLTRLDAVLARAVVVCLSLEECDQEEEEERKQQQQKPSAPYLASQLRLLADLLSEASALVKGGSPGTANANTGDRPGTAPSPLATGSERQHHAHLQPPFSLPETPSGKASWTTCSVPLSHFAPPLSRNISFFATIQDACLVLYLRALEPADAPVNLGTKLALAIGTTRRLEHDEADRIFPYRCNDDDFEAESGGSTGNGIGTRTGAVARAGAEKEVEVYVREKVRVESADPSLLSLSAKLNALANTLALARRNLVAVMGEDMEDI